MKAYGNNLPSGNPGRKGRHGGMKWTEAIRVLSQSGLGALVLDSAGVILAVNPTGNELLHGEGRLKGKELPLFARILLQPEEEGMYANPAFGEYLRRCPEPLVDDLPQGARLLVFRKANQDACHDMLLGALSQINQSVIICDEGNRIVYLNDAAVRMDGLDNTRVVGRTISEIYQSRDDHGLLIPWVIAHRKPLLDIRQHYATCQGKEVDITANCYPLVQNGQTLGGCSIMEDWSQVDSLHRKIIDLQEKILQLTQGKGKTEKKNVFRARYQFQDIIHAGPAMANLIDRARHVAQSDSNVLVYGETGTGKELLVQSIHNASRRAQGPFLAINCAAIPENLLEGILFGTEKGAYTGAEKRPGLFEQAHGGTLLLDEINSMNINLQPKLLRVLQEGMARRVGGMQEYPVDVRVLSNMNISPQEALKEGKLRLDLFYRLGVVDLRVPPLRERKEDIPLLVKHFIMGYNRKLKKNVRYVDGQVQDLFLRYPWPGNVRELQHAIEFAMNVLPDDRNVIRLADLPDNIRLETSGEIPAGTEAAISRPAVEHGRVPRSQGNRRTLREVEQAAIEQALRLNRGNISAAARQLGMSRQNLQYRIRRDRIQREPEER